MLIRNKILMLIFCLQVVFSFTLCEMAAADQEDEQTITGGYIFGASNPLDPEQSEVADGLLDATLPSPSIYDSNSGPDLILSRQSVTGMNTSETLDKNPPVEIAFNGGCGTPTFTGIWIYDEAFSSGFQWDSNNQEDWNCSGPLNLNVVGGTAPYTWKIEGTGFSLAAQNEPTGTSNTLYADSSACATTITVLDHYARVAKGYVRCTRGYWKHIGSFCGLEGKAQEKRWSQPYWIFTRTEADKKQVIWTSHAGGGANCEDPNPWGSNDWSDYCNTEQCDSSGHGDQSPCLDVYDLTGWRICECYTTYSGGNPIWNCDYIVVSNYEEYVCN